MRLTLKNGTAQLEFEGSSDEFEKHVQPVISDFFGTLLVDSALDETGQPVAQRANLRLTPKAVATVLGGDTGSALLYSAAASLAVVEEMETFTRQNLLDRMKQAVGFYKPTYNNNLSSYVDGLCKRGVLIEVGSQIYTVKASELGLMQQRLREAA